MNFDNSRYKYLPAGDALVQKLAKDFYTPNTTREKGPFLAKVLRVVQTNASTDDSVTWIDEMNASFKANAEEGAISPFDTMLRLKVHARIDDKYLPGQPNLHIGIPEPKQVGNADAVTAQDDVFILQHPEFISLNETAASFIPTPGDFVWVDFLDKQTYSKPVYLGPLKGIVAGVPGSPPCGAQNTAQSTFQQGAPAGGALKGNTTNNPKVLKGATVGGKGKLGKAYKLHGYVAGDFTKQKRFLQEPYISNMERMLAGVEIMHWYLEQLYPGKAIKIYDPKAATTWGHAAKSSHKWGIGLDFKAKIGGKKMDNTTAWAVIFRLIIAGKIPDGGVGFYQTNSGRRNIATTYGTNLKPSGCPHWDPETKTNDPKCPKPGGYKTRKWYWGTKNNKTVTVYGEKTAAGQLKKPKVPRYAVQRYNELQEPAADMPTWAEVLKARASAAAEKKPVTSAKVENTTPPNGKPKSPKTTPQDEKKKTATKPTTGSEPKKEDKKKNENKAKKAATDQKKTEDKKKAEASKKATTDEKKAKAAKLTKPTKPTAAPAPTTPTTTPCAQNTPGGGGGGGAGGGTQQGPPGSMKVLPGSALKLPKAKKPKGLYSNPKVTSDIYADPKDKGRLQHVSMFVCHETGKMGAFGTSYKAARNRARKIQKQEMRKVTWKDKKTGQKMSKMKQYDSWRQVHFWGGAAGDISMTTPLNSPNAHATWTNWHSLGYELINKVFLSKKNKRTTDPSLGYRVLGPNGNVGGTMDHTYPDGTKQKGTGVIKSKIGVEPGSGHYALPTEIQCRRIWETILWCSLKNPNRMHPKVLKIPIKFPATANSAKFGTGFKSSANGGKPFFVWGRFAPNVASFKLGMAAGPYENAWKAGGRAKIPRLPFNKHWQQGIVAHFRWSSHTDGCFPEYYCLARANGMGSIDAYLAACGAIAASNPRNNRKLSAGKRNYTQFSNTDMVNYGIKIWGRRPSLNDLNWSQKGTSLVGPTGKYGKAVGKLGGKATFAKRIG